MTRASLLFVGLALAGCSDDDVVVPPPGVGLTAIAGTRVIFDLEADLGEGATFYDFPYPSDLRLSDSGGPDLRGFPMPAGNLAETMIAAAEDRPGFASMPVAYFRFDGPMSAPGAGTPIAAAPSSAVLLIDVDRDSPDRGALYPTSAQLHAPDAYTPDNLLAVGVHAGVVLPADRSYALVVMRSFEDAAGDALGVPLALVELAAGETPAAGEAVAALYGALYETLDSIGVERSEVAAATVFTVGDVVRETKELTDALLDAHDVGIDDLALDPSDGADHPRFCELHATMALPQFQQGTPPFNGEGGAFVIGEGGLPTELRAETAPVVITLPKQAMPAGGYPLVLYIHGSGGVAAQLVDRGKITMVDGNATPGEGPAHVVAEHGFAAVGAAMPLNPERVPSAGPYDYINQTNLGAFSYTFRQGVIEQRLLIEALSELTIDPATLGSCTGPTLPAGATAFRFDMAPLFGMGQSMGAQYLNLLSAVEPTIGAIAPTGAGGHWSKFMIVSPLFGGVVTIAAALLGAEEDNLTHLHPVLQLLQTAWEAGDALASLPRIARRPFEGSPARAIYTPVGRGDEFFPTTLFDAMAMGYGTQQAGAELWESMQQELALVGFDGKARYPVANNRTSESGESYTAAVVQYEGDGIADPHTIFSQLDEVKYQYGCFFATFWQSGVARLPAPAPLGTACP